MTAQAVPHGPPVEFLSTSTWGRRVACTVCGRFGMPGSGPNPQPWQKVCLRGHKPCDYCGRMSPVKLDGMARVHTRCPA